MCFNKVILHQFHSVCAILLGMKDGTIQDSQITASSELGEKYPAVNARLDRPRIDGKVAWVSATNDLNQWIQVEFTTHTYVSGILLQGRAESVGLMWVTRYTVEYSSDGETWQVVQNGEGVHDMVSTKLSK